MAPFDAARSRAGASHDGPTASAAASVVNSRPTLKLKRFDPYTMPDNASCVILAESGGGKTTLGVDLMHTKRHLPAWSLFSTSEGCSQRLSQTIPATYTYTTLNHAALTKIYNSQQRRMIKYTRKRSVAERRMIPDDELTITDRFVKNPCIGTYFEDCFNDKKVFNKPIVQDLFKNGRHRMIFSILPCQYVMDIPQACRPQVKYWFILREDRPKIRRKIFDEVGGACKTWELFNEIMDQCTNDFGCIVIDNLSKSPNIEDRVFCYRAKLHKAFRVGCRRYWKFHKKNYNGGAKARDPDAEEAKRMLGRKTKRSRTMTSSPTASQVEHARAGLALVNEMRTRHNSGPPNINDYIRNGGGRKRPPMFNIELPREMTPPVAAAG